MLSGKCQPAQHSLGKIPRVTNMAAGDRQRYRRHVNRFADKVGRSGDLPEVSTAQSPHYRRYSDASVFSLQQIFLIYSRTAS
jgi:hypothetical protein